MSSLTEIAQQLKANKEPIILIYAFNSTGKTQLCVEYKNITKTEKVNTQGFITMHIVKICSCGIMMNKMLMKTGDLK
jgi:hypothetical protein